ncbi:PBP1A family penicillin-binding protein [Synechococcus sp. CBW1107]|uniref:transglycosylase domain-containing protein n=1 Tax=Synechococcus sp. CBW1107 TaxID=2789857 RepID=UPI002AD2CAB5|nr:PBP1A family penicillin-binding protein [Synechococcus sp. CBW1107]CAK6700415.1 Penicillin-binding protein 1F [Synechococcus sp. CBW1107]
MTGRRRRPLLRAGLIGAGAGVAVAFGQSLLVQSIDSLLPNVQRVSSYNRPGTVTVLSADGQVIQKLGPATRDKLISGQMPLLVQRAFIAAEDRRFYDHDGIDPVGIGRAVVRNVRRGAVEEGASTITQQLARTVFLSQDRTIIRKLKEALLAGKLERQLSKQQILEQYLNYVYLGSSAYGVSDAAWIYFSKRPAELTLPEAALIAGLPPAPSVYSPLVNPDLALQRRATVLRRMRESGFIDDLQLQSANNSPLLLKPAEPKYWTSRAPYFTSWVAQELPKVLSPEDLEVGGLTIRTSLNMSWQEGAQATINKHARGAMEGAVVSMEPGTGLVRTMVGGKDFNKSQFNRASQALRSPGSTFKLFVYLTALKEGMRPEDKVNDKKQCFGGYCPRNFGNKYRGVVPMWVALQQSLNTVSVSLLKQLGFDKVIATTKSLGITRELGRFYPLAVGATEQTVLDMTAAYAAIFNRGVYTTPTPFEEILGPNGELLWSRRVDGDRGRRAVPSDIADAMLWMLQQVVKGGTGYGAVPPNRPAAGKTGTSEGGRDLWFIGGVPQLVTGLWLGYDNNKETKSTSAVAVVAWADYMRPILKDLPVRPFPPKPQLAGKFDPLQPLKPKPKPEPKPQATPEAKPTAPAAGSAEPELSPPDTTPAPAAPSVPEPTAAPAAPATRPTAPQPVMPAPLPVPTPPPPLP